MFWMEYFKFEMKFTEIILKRKIILNENEKDIEIEEENYGDSKKEKVKI